MRSGRRFVLVATTLDTMSSKLNDDDTETLQSVNLTESSDIRLDSGDESGAGSEADDNYDDLIIPSPAYNPEQPPSSTRAQDSHKPDVPASKTPAGRSFHLPASGTEVYMAEPRNGSGETRDAAANPDLLVILLTNSLGITSRNNLALAHLYADRLGCPVAVPDLFEGEPVTTGGAVLHEDGNDAEARDAQQPAVELSPAGAALAARDAARAQTGSAVNGATAPKRSLLSLVKTFAVSTVKGFLEDMWAARHTAEHTLPIVQQTVVELISVYRPAKVVVVGYSFGARYVVKLLTASPPQFVAAQWASGSGNGSSGSAAEASNAYDRILCGAVIHPSLLEPADFKDVVKPLYLVYSKDDELLPESLVHAGLRVLDERGGSTPTTAPVETTVYDNDTERAANPAVQPLPHGFAVPGDYPAAIVGDRPQRVFSVVTSWISEHL